MSKHTLSRREVLAGSVAAGAIALIGDEPAAAADEKKTFTILHTNDIHSNLIGMAPSSDYTPFTLNENPRRIRTARLIAARKEARRNQGPALILDGDDYSMGTRGRLI